MLLINCPKDSKQFRKYTKLRVRLLREKMSVLATTKDYAGAFEAYEQGFDLQQKVLYADCTTNFKMLSSQYLMALYMKPID